MPSSKPRPPAVDQLQDIKPAEDTEDGGAESGTTDAGGTTQDGDGATPASGWWRFSGAYACAYTTPDRVSQWIQPGQVVAWPDGPPDANWEPAPVPEPEPAPAVSDQNTEE